MTLSTLSLRTLLYLYIDSRTVVPAIDFYPGHFKYMLMMMIHVVHTGPPLDPPLVACWLNVT